MGMFDSLYDAQSNEWQTKAFDRLLDSYGIGDEVPTYGVTTFQVEILGGTDEPPFIQSLATIRDGRLVSLPDERDESLPLMDYSGFVFVAGDPR